MKQKILVLSVPLCTLLSLPLLAQKPQDASESSSLTRVQSDDANSGLQRVYVPSQDPSAPALVPVDRAAWQKRLSVTDLDARERALDEVIELARSNDHARLMLEEWSLDQLDVELAWTARMALRDLKRAGTRPERSVPPAVQSPFQDLSREIEEMMLQLHDPMFAPRGVDLDRLFGGFGRGIDRDWSSIFAPGMQGGVDESKRFSLQVAPDGVRCELFECIDGQEVKREYEADSYEELLELYPELQEHLEAGDGSGFPTIRFGTPGSGFLRGTPLEELQRQSPALQPNRTDRLGIEASTPDANRVAELGLAEGQGMLVERILTNSIASAVGIRRGDLVIEMNGQAIFDGADIRRVLAERPEKEELKVVVINRRDQRRELVWKPGL